MQRKHGWVWSLLLVLLFALSASGCKGDGKAKADDPVWIKVNSVEIHKSQVENEIARLQAPYQDQLAQMPPEQRPQIEAMMKTKAMNNLVQMAVLDQAADKEGITVDPKVVEEEFAKLKAQVQDEATFQQRLKELKMTEEELKKEITRQLRYEELFKKKIQVTPPTDADILAFYEKSKANYLEPEKAVVTNILFQLVPMASDDEKKKKRELAEATLKRIQGGEDIAKLAGELSDAPSKANGGKDTFTKGQNLDLDKAVFALKPGEVSPLIETPAGFYIVKLVEIVPEKATPLETVKEEIVQRLENEKKREAAKAYMDSLMQAATIVYIEKLPEMAPMPGEGGPPPEEPGAPPGEAGPPPGEPAPGGPGPEPAPGGPGPEPAPGGPGPAPAPGGPGPAPAPGEPAPAPAPGGPAPAPGAPPPPPAPAPGGPAPAPGAPPPPAPPAPAPAPGGPAPR